MSGGGKTVAFSRYHLSPHSPNLVRVRIFAEQGVQPPSYFDHDSAWARRVSENRHCLDKVSDGFSGVRISGIDALG